eukprot:TRINITY_DN22547_c0_g1_i1.p1 TRINITY_DN22547_c0_g1~~TRINITY_DN22547_c0_g1_i1.p1  ORF type:complete len:307 (-),score=84.41 TRINITY_DN22547_c0_g1_i1:190-1110(-)
MGLVCSRCADLEKAKPGAEATGMVPDLESDIDDCHEDESHVGDTSDEGEDHSAMKEGVEKILREAGKTLKRGKTMAMKEAISTAKKHNVDNAKIGEAEKMLTDHKRRQLQEDTEKEVEHFFVSTHVRDIHHAEKVVKKVRDAGCRAEVLKRVEDHLHELIVTRPLEPEEETQSCCVMKQSCREFVLSAVSGDGRPVTLLGIDDGKFTSGRLSLDPPLLNLMLARAEGGLKMALSSLSACPGKDEVRTKTSKFFQALDVGERNCIVALRYESNGTPGVLLIQEPSQGQRDRLREAIVLLRGIASDGG